MTHKNKKSDDRSCSTLDYLSDYTQHNKKQKVRSWEVEETVTEEEFRMIRYATRCCLLQERAGLTFIQARIFLHKEKPETLEDISIKFNVPLEKIIEAEPIIRKKVEEAEKDHEYSSDILHLFDCRCQWVILT